MSATCLAPMRCGSDGKECCHPSCFYSPEKRVERAHLDALTATALQRSHPNPDPAVGVSRKDNQ